MAAPLILEFRFRAVGFVSGTAADSEFAGDRGLFGSAAVSSRRGLRGRFGGCATASAFGASVTEVSAGTAGVGGRRRGFHDGGGRRLDDDGRTLGGDLEGGDQLRLECGQRERRTWCRGGRRRPGLWPSGVGRGGEMLLRGGPNELRPAPRRRTLRSYPETESSRSLSLVRRAASSFSSSSFSASLAAASCA